MQIKAIQESKLLRELERKYDVREVKYNLLNYKFEYIQNGEVKTLGLDQLVSHLYQDVPKDEVLLKLEMIVDNYIPQFLNEQLITFYRNHQLDLPPSLFLFKGLIQFIDGKGYEYYIPFDRPLEQIFTQFEVIVNSVND